MQTVTDRQNASKRRVRFALALLALLPFSSGGCRRKSEGPPTFPVRGVLMVDGKAAENAQVILHPADGRDFDRRGARPTGKVGPDGAFSLTTYVPDDGAPAGRYVVTVYWAENPDSLEPSPDRLQGRFLEPSRSALHAEIGESPTQLPPWNLTTR